MKTLAMASLGSKWIASGTLSALRPSVAVGVTLNLVCLLIKDLEHPRLFFPVHQDVLLHPLLLVDLGHMTDDILLAVVGVSTRHTLVRLHPWVEVEL